MAFHVPEKFRFRMPGHEYDSDESFGNNGMFFVRVKGVATPLKIICSDGEGWEHVSVSLTTRCPTWQEMCLIKALFWDEEDCVVQYHPARSDYVNCHPFCLHLWRSTSAEFPKPPSWMVGTKENT